VGEDPEGEDPEGEDPAMGVPAVGAPEGEVPGVAGAPGAGREGPAAEPTSRLLVDKPQMIINWLCMAMCFA
jgi:hypothetical protein